MTIKVKLLADSINAQGNRLRTFEVDCPRIIWCEQLTHSILVRNASSSRAIPFLKMQGQLNGVPVGFGQANKGMQDLLVDYDAPVTIFDIDSMSYFTGSPQNAWNVAKNNAIHGSKAYYDAGYSKQIFNRLSEAFQMIKAVISGTEFENYYWLRDDTDADPTIQALARAMKEAEDESEPELLEKGMYHLPYIYKELHLSGEGGLTELYYLDEERTQQVTLEQAIKCSCARAAAVSYRNDVHDLEACLRLYSRLVDGEKVHASALSHVAWPMSPAKQVCIETEYADGYCLDIDKSVNIQAYPQTWQDGISHVTKDGLLWSAQYCGFIMYRKVVKDEAVKG